MNPAILLEDVHFTLDGQPILAGISFSVPAGGFTCLLGPSGCGKTTLLRLLGGLMEGYQGHIRVAGRPPAEAWPRLAYVFQTARLVPWRDVLGNVLLAMELRFRRRPTLTDRDRALALLETVGLGGMASRKPHGLSGGERHRVALARALAVDPDIILMDEPMANLDVATRERLRREILRLWQETGKTILLVTHDIEEALELGQELVLLGGRPARVVDWVEVPFPHPRRSYVQDAQWRALAERVRSAFPQWEAGDDERGGTRLPEEQHARGVGKGWRGYSVP